MVAASRPDARAASVPAEARRARVVPGGAAGFAPRDILGNIGWLLAAQAIAGGGQFALSVLLARHLGAETYGQWTFAFAFVSLFAFLADFGFPMLAVRDLARGPANAGRYLGNVLLLKAAGSLVLVALLAGILIPLEHDAAVRALVLLLAGQMLLTSFSQVLFSVFRARNRVQFEALARGLQVVLLLGLVLLVVGRGGAALAFGWAWLAAAAVGVAFTAGLVMTKFIRPHLGFDAALCKALLREVWPIGVAVTFTSVYYYADVVLLRFMGREQAVGWYGAAYVPVLGLVVVIGAVRNAYFPALAQSVRDVTHSRLLREYGRLTAMLAVPIAVCGPLAARALVELLYGSSFAPATDALRLLFVMSGVMFFSSYFGSELLAAGRQRVYLAGAAVGAALNLLLNAVLIPQFSLNGAAGATLASEGVVCIFMWWQTRELGVPVGDLVIRAGGVAALIGATLLAGLLVAPPVLAIGAAGVVYTVVLWLWDGGEFRWQLGSGLGDG